MWKNSDVECRNTEVTARHGSGRISVMNTGLKNSAFVTPSPGIHCSR